jgi:hypothetical protein
MLTWAFAWYVVGFAAECGGFVLIVSEALGSRSALREWVAANPNKNEDGSWGQMRLTNKVMLGLLGSTRRRFTAAVLVGLGILAGFLGNLASLPSV